MEMSLSEVTSLCKHPRLYPHTHTGKGGAASSTLRLGHSILLLGYKPVKQATAEQCGQLM